MGEIFTLILAFGAGLQLIVEWLRDSFDPKAKLPRWIWVVLALFLGETIAIVYNLNAFRVLQEVTAGRTQALTGQILTGVLLAAGSGLIHKLKAAFEGVAKR